MTPAITPLLSPAERGRDVIDLGLALRLLALDYLILALQGTVMRHLQTDHLRCQLAPLAVTLAGFRLGLLSGAAHGFLLGLANGALFSEPTGIPALTAMLLGGSAGAMRHSFRVEALAVRVTLALALLGLGALVTHAVTLVVWHRVPPLLPLSAAVCVPLVPGVDRLVRLFLPER